MSTEFYNLLLYNIENLLSHINITGWNFFYDNIEKIMSTNQLIDPIIMYKNIIYILTIYRYNTRNLLIYSNCVSEYHYRHKYDNDILSKIKKMVFLQNNISSYFINLMFAISEFHIKNDIDFQTYGFNPYPNLRDIDQLQIFEKFLKNLHDFKIIQFKIFNTKKLISLEKFNTNKYNNIFEKLLNRYIERLIIAEFEIIKIKYANRMGLDYSLDDAREYFNNLIANCNKEDSTCPIF